MTLVSDYDYNLPQELIAQTVLHERSASRLMLVDKQRGLVGETVFSHIGKWLVAGDLLVVNNTRVIPARLSGSKPSGGAVELLLLEQKSATSWLTLVRPGRRMPSGTEVVFGDGSLKCKITEHYSSGERLAEFSWCADSSFPEVLQQLGETPLPPYIRQSLQDIERYQTVYGSVPGSVAAPTAGLHFTSDLIMQLAGMGVTTVEVTLNIGLGTFRPVKTEQVSDHAMHSEAYSISEATAAELNLARQERRRIIAVGTTSCRVLEASISSEGVFTAQEGRTSLFITPGYHFKAIDGIITNFHLPKSTLLMLVAAMAGREEILQIYAEAVKREYRFFSFGDAMFIAEHV